MLPVWGLKISGICCVTQSAAKRVIVLADEQIMLIENGCTTMYEMLHYNRCSAQQGGHRAASTLTRHRH